MTKEEFQDLRTGDIVTPITGPLRGQNFEIIETGYGYTEARLRNDYMIQTWIDYGVVQTITWQEGYRRTVHWNSFKFVRRY